MMNLKRREGASPAAMESLSDDQAAVWAAVDGQRGVAQVAAALGWPERRVWAAVDGLADLGLVERLAPPAAVGVFSGAGVMSRREALQRLTAGLVGGVAAVSAARVALAEERKIATPARREEERRKESSAKDVTTWEGRVKEQEEKLKAAEQCRESNRADEARKKACADPRRVREDKEKAERQLTNARRQEEDVKRAHKIREQAEETRKDR
jgi:hypothetical protein